MDLNYDYPLYRPPSEGNSMIFQVTLGCSFNKCSFCNMYRTKSYSERPWDEIQMEIDLASKFYPDLGSQTSSDMEFAQPPASEPLRPKAI